MIRGRILAPQVKFAGQEQCSKWAIQPRAQSVKTGPVVRGGQRDPFAIADHLVKQAEIVEGKTIVENIEIGKDGEEADSRAVEPMWHRLIAVQVEAVTRPL